MLLNGISKSEGLKQFHFVEDFGLICFVNSPAHDLEVFFRFILVNSMASGLQGKHAGAVPRSLRLVRVMSVVLASSRR